MTENTQLILALVGAMFSITAIGISIFFYYKSGDQISDSANATAISAELVSLVTQKQGIYSDIREMKMSISTAKSIITDRTSESRRQMLIEDIQSMSGALEHLHGVDDWYEERLNEARRSLASYMTGATSFDEETNWKEFRNEPDRPSSAYVNFKAPLFTAMIYKMVDETNTDFMETFQIMAENVVYADGSKLSDHKVKHKFKERR